MANGSIAVPSPQGQRLNNKTSHPSPVHSTQQPHKTWLHGPYHGLHGKTNLKWMKHGANAHFRKPPYIYIYIYTYIYTYTCTCTYTYTCTCTSTYTHALICLYVYMYSIYVYIFTNSLTSYIHGNLHSIGNRKPCTSELESWPFEPLTDTLPGLRFPNRSFRGWPKDQDIA